MTKIKTGDTILRIENLTPGTAFVPTCTIDDSAWVGHYVVLAVHEETVQESDLTIQYDEFVMWVFGPDMLQRGLTADRRGCKIHTWRIKKITSTWTRMVGLAGRG